MFAVVYVMMALLGLVINNVDCRTLTTDDITGIKATITSTFEMEASYGTYCNGKVSTCAMGDTVGKLVRLAFHDATGNGGANGCIDFVNTKANKGLEDAVVALDNMYYANGYDSIISKADLYVLAANTAIEFATTEATSSRRSLQAPAGDPLVGAPPDAGAGPSMAPTTFASTLDTPPYILSLPFRYGRVDSYTCNDAGALPELNYTWTQINGLFGGRMGMNVKEVVAIMGAHSVGRCHYENSGIDGGHTNSQSSFSNTFYKSFTEGIFRNDNHSDLWVNLGENTIMLMPDVELLFSSNTMGDGTCAQFNTMEATSFCPLQAQSSASFVAYANNIDQFYANYSTAWQKMTEYGFSDLVVEVDGTYAGTYPYLSGAPSVIPTASPTFAPTTSASPTLAPTAALTNAPSALPTAVPTVFPSEIPTASPTEPLLGTPTEFPTQVPTEFPTENPTYMPSAALTRTVAAYQILQGIDSVSWYADSNVQISFEQAVAASCGNGMLYTDVSVTAVADVSVAVGAFAMRLLSSSVVVTYSFSAPVVSANEIIAALVSNVDGGSFSAYLQSFGQSNGVSVLSSGDVTAEPNSISFATDAPTSEPTFAPTAIPTAVTGATTTSGDSSSSSNHGISTTNIIIIVVVLGVSALATVAVVCYRYFYTDAYTAYLAPENSAPGADSTSL
jgi:hypothetical protein